jgi:voltage-gated sodium channel
MKKFFLNDHIILGVILLNSVLIYLQESGISHPVLTVLDLMCTLIFVVEMVVKHVDYGVKGYWSDGWNRFDGVLVILSLPSLITPFVDITGFDFSLLLTLRLMRVLRIFRVLHFFPKVAQIGAGLRRALRDSGVVLVGFLLFIFIFGMINCGLYREVVPEYFGSPMDAIYTVFRVFTVEGWYEVPDAIAAATTPFIGRMSRLYFCLLLGIFGLLGMSFINSVFVDAMAEDNNDDLKVQLDRIERKLEELENKKN